MGKKFKYRFKHGLGDACDFGVVLRHVRAQNPDCHITLETLPGREALFRHLVDHIVPYPWEPYAWLPWGFDDARYIKFPAATVERSANVPPNKVAECLFSDFADTIKPDPDLYGYTVSIDPAAADRVAQWFAQLPRPIVTFHYEGVSHPDKKNIPIGDVKRIAWGLAGDATVILLDWRFNKIQNGKTIWVPPNANIPQDSDHLAALIDQSDAFIGIDSGPAHIAGALETPAWVIWYGHFPSTCFDHMAINVEHVLTMDAVAASPNDRAWEWFTQNYRYTLCGVEMFQDNSEFPRFLCPVDVVVEGALHTVGATAKHPHIEDGLATFDGTEWPPMIIYHDQPIIEFEP